MNLKEKKVKSLNIFNLKYPVLNYYLHLKLLIYQGKITTEQLEEQLKLYDFGRQLEDEDYDNIYFQNRFNEELETFIETYEKSRNTNCS